jgi:hypothetical protein
MGSGPRLKKSSQDPRIRRPAAQASVVVVDESLSIVHEKVHTVRPAEDLSIVAVEAAKSSTQVRATAYWPVVKTRPFPGKPQIRLWKIGGQRKTEVENQFSKATWNPVFSIISLLSKREPYCSEVWHAEC